MLGLRNKFVAHLDLSKPFNEPTPIFDTALQVACAYQGWVKWLIRASGVGLPLDMGGPGVHLAI